MLVGELAYFYVDWGHAMLGHDKNRLYMFSDGFIRQMKLQQRSHGRRGNTVFSSAQFWFER